MGGLKVDPNGSVFFAVFLLLNKQLKVLASYLSVEFHMHAIISIDLASPASVFIHY